MRPPQARQRKDSSKHVGADRVVDDVDAAVARQLLDPVAQPLAVVDRVVGAFFQAAARFSRCWRWR